VLPSYNIEVSSLQQATGALRSATTAGRAQPVNKSAALICLHLGGRFGALYLTELPWPPLVLLFIYERL
jgi:hypothetical protein